MAEEIPEIDPGKEAKRIVNKYLSEVGWAKEYKNMAVGSSYLRLKRMLN